MFSICVAKVLRPDHVDRRARVARPRTRGRDPRRTVPSRDRARLRRGARGAAPARDDRAPRGAVPEAACQARGAAPAPAAPAARAARCRRASVPEQRGRRPPRRQAGQHHHGRSATTHRPQHRALLRARGAAHLADRDRRLHGARAMRLPSATTSRSATRPTSGASARRSTAPCLARGPSHARSRLATATCSRSVFRSCVRPPEPLPRDLPEPLTALIDSMLDPDASARPAAGEVAERLEPLVAELPRKVPLASAAHSAFADSRDLFGRSGP